jgi:hypothetical protein
MAETWPGSLPQYINRNGFSYSLSNSSISSNMSTGYAKRRKKYTGQYATYTVSIDMTQTQADIFEQFFNNNLGYGVEEITFPDPLFIDATIDARVKAGADGNPYSFGVYGDNDQVILSMELERLITGYSTVSTALWPITLPTCPQFSGYTNNTQSGLIRDSDESTGVVNVRRRFTAVTRTHNVTFILTRAELDIFFNFYASLGYGCKSFVAPWPINDGATMKARFDASQGYTVAYHGETELFEVSFVWEELPPVKEWI